MRILQVITGLPKAAGTSVFCGELANGLVALGHDVTIAVCDPSTPDLHPLDHGVQRVSIESILRCPSPSTFATSFSLVHIHALWSPPLHRISVWARKNRIPVVWSPHGMITPWAMRNKRLKKLLAWHLYQKRDLQSAALLHATAQSEVEDIRRLGLKNEVVIAPLGVRLPKSVGRDVPSAPQKRTKTLLFVSRVQRKKGLPNLIAAWSRLPADLREGWQIRIVGPDQDNHTAELRELCKGLGIRDSGADAEVAFVGPKYGDELSAEYDNADLFVLPTHSENFGSVVIEALAHSVPVITTKQAPWAELEEFKCGWWIDDNVDALTAALRGAVEQSNNPNNRTNLQEMGENGRKLVDARYTWSAVCDKMMKGYKEVLQTSRVVLV